MLAIVRPLRLAIRMFALAVLIGCSRLPQPPASQKLPAHTSRTFIRIVQG